jgi:catechol 2,3-dioxygenase-like lactoylglutathione lyase family enzyme
MSDVQRMTSLGAVHHVGLVTGQLDHMRRFYTEALGLAEVRGFPEHDVVFLAAGGVLIELVGQGDASVRTQRTGWHHLAWSVDDVDATFIRLIERGAAVHSSPEPFPPETPEFRIAFLRDPDGNLLELVQRLRGQVR